MVFESLCIFESTYFFQPGLPTGREGWVCKVVQGLATHSQVLGLILTSREPLEDFMQDGETQPNALLEKVALSTSALSAVFHLTLPGWPCTIFSKEVARVRYCRDVL